MSTQPSRHVERMTRKHIDGAIECIATTFGGNKDITEAPMSWLCNLRKHHWRDMAGMFIERSASRPDPLSVVCINDETGLIDGVMVNEDWKTAPPPAYSHVSDSWLPVKGIFNELHTRMKAETSRHIMPGEELHCLYFTCVRPEARQQGVMRSLWAETIAIGEDHNFSGLVAESASEQVAEVLGKLGFRERASVGYDEFKFHGNVVFEELVEEAPEELKKLAIHHRNIYSGLV